jgi:hypothetical protein
MITMAQKQRNIEKGARMKHIHILIPSELYTFVKEYCEEKEMSQAYYFTDLLTREKNLHKQEKIL